MTPIGTRIPLALAALSLIALPAWSDTIKRTDGKLVEEVRIESETLTEVTYKKGNKDGSVPADEVLEVIYEKKPSLVDEADGYARDGDYGSAEVLLDDYLTGHLGGDEEKRFKWAPAYAAWRVTELRLMMGELDGVIAAADRLIGSFPDSRFLPLAYTTKADALVWQGKNKEAQKALEAFEALISDNGLSKRWDLECQLALVRTDGALSGADKRDKLGVIQNLAGGDYPSVQNRAKVGVGESFIEDASSERDSARRLNLVSQARSIFEEIIEDFKADNETLAGARTGLGDCLLQEAVAANNDPALLKQSLHQYMRTIVVYKQQTRYQAKSLCLAGRCYQLLGEEEDKKRARSLFSRTIRDFPDSPWATQARTFRG